jgi:hypothetical protein
MLAKLPPPIRLPGLVLFALALPWPLSARESIVGAWAESAGACGGDLGGALIEPKAIVFGEDTRCEFPTVSRNGAVVRWTGGTCLRGANNTPTDRNVTATASLDAGRLRLRIANPTATIADVTLVRCRRGGRP